MSLNGFDFSVPMKPRSSRLASGWSVNGWAKWKSSAFRTLGFPGLLASGREFESPQSSFLLDLWKPSRRESNQAMAHWWGVTGRTVTRRRKTLDAPMMTEGTSHLRSEYAQDEAATRGLRKARAKARDRKRRRKQKTKMSAAHKRRGMIPAKAGRLWTAEEDEAVRALPAEAAAAKIGRTLTAVYVRRHRLGVPGARRRQ